MSQDTTLYLNESDKYDEFGNRHRIMVVLPLHRSDENSEYYAYVGREETISDLKEMIKAKLASHPPVNEQRVIYRGKVLGDAVVLGPLLAERSEELPHFHIVLNNSSRINSGGAAASSSTQLPATSLSDQDNYEPLPSYSPNHANANTSIPLSHTALRAYMQSIRGGVELLSSFPVVNRPVFYQFVTVNGRAYLISVPPPRPSSFLGDLQGGGVPEVQHNRPFYIRAWENANTLWPSIWLAIKLLFFYVLLSNGTSLYKKMLFGAVAIIIFAFQHGVIDVQIEVIRNQPQEANNIPANAQAPNAGGNQETTRAANETGQADAPPQQPESAIYPLLQALKTFFLSFFPAREAAENPRPQMI